MPWWRRTWWREHVLIQRFCAFFVHHFRCVPTGLHSSTPQRRCPGGGGCGGGGVYSDARCTEAGVGGKGV